MNNRTLLDDTTIILNNNEFFENERKHAEQNFLEQTKLDEKITNNMLKMNVVLYLISICLAFLFTLNSPEVMYVRPINFNPNIKYELRFSLLKWVYRTEQEKQTNNLYCILDNSCENVNLDDIIKDFNLSLDKFNVFRIAGIIVNYYLI